MAIDSVVVDVRIGTPGPKRLTEARIAFQNEALALVFPGEPINRLGHMHFFPFSYGKLYGDAAHIEEILETACLLFTQCSETTKRVLLIDFTESPIDLVREPILLHLASKMEALFKEKTCSQGIVLLPFRLLPVNDSLLISRLNRIESEAPNCSVVIVVADGTFQKLPRGDNGIFPSYGALMNRQQADPLDQLKRKLVRRIGRFRNSSQKGKTRVFSYLIDNCADELLTLLRQWWSNKEPECDALLYDTGNMPSMTEAVRAFGQEKGIRFFRIPTLKSDPQLIRKIPLPRRCLIVLDVVETGQTLLEHAHWLKSQKCSLNNDVLAVINRGGSLEQHIGEFTVRTFIRVDSDPDFPARIQDALGLPYSFHSSETFEPIRSFDMWFMAHEAGWEPEPDVPEDGYAYKVVPVFPRMLEMFGDWIAYKMHDALRRRGIPEDFFVIHPDESGAISVGDKLRTRLDPKLIIVRVPRRFIREAQKRGQNWQKVLSMINQDEEWLYRLQSIQGASAIITDIFNGSGGTFTTLFELLRHFGIPCAGYFPFIDRDDFIQKDEKYPIQRFCLYSWFGPRKKKLAQEERNV